MTERLTRWHKIGGVICTDCLNDYSDCFNCPHFNKMREKLAHYEDLEEQGRLVELLAENDFKRDELDRCRHRHCNKCDGYRKEIQRYKDLEEQGRLIVLPEGFDAQALKEELIKRHCPSFIGLDDLGCKAGKSVKVSSCFECWEKAWEGKRNETTT